MTIGTMEGKKGVVFGVANAHSIAWGITQAMADAGAQLCLTYQGERFERTIRTLAEDLQDPLLVPCDVTVDEQIEGVFETVAEEFGRCDFVVHSVAFAPRDALEGRFVETSREAYHVAQDISAYSLIGIARAARPLLIESRGSMIALSYYGAEKVVPSYNVMGVAKASLEANVRYLAADLGAEGIRVNAISAGPLNTLAARGIKGFRTLLSGHGDRAPLRRNVELDEVAKTAVFLLSDGASGITGETVYVDAGYNIMGV